MFLDTFHGEGIHGQILTLLYGKYLYVLSGLGTLEIPLMEL